MFREITAKKERGSWSDEPLPLRLRVNESTLRSYLYAAGFDWYLREIISADELASTGLNYVIEENLADRIVARAWFTVVKNSEEGSVKLIVENRISSLPNGAAEAGSVSDDLQTGDVELSIVLRIKRG